MQTIPFNVTGHPAMSVPVGLAADGLPLSVQIAGRPFDEATVLRVGRAIEVLSGWERLPLPG
jgi:aspartyl-tRNA(Asn)/glutamyl-tRNA(Gln) amidotransferase subunit A